jgi:cytochrome c
VLNLIHAWGDGRAVLLIFRVTLGLAWVALSVGNLTAERLSRTVLVSGLQEPTALDVAADGRIWIAERAGALKVWDPRLFTLQSVGQLEVFTGPEDGLLCLALSPGFATNHWVFLFHSTPGVLENRVSRFSLTHGGLDLASQKILLRIPTLIPKPNHSGGGLGFDAAGNLYVSTGDYTYANQSQGFAPLDRRPGHALNDSERTAANSADLRGKILRVHPEADGAYTIPPGNLFSPGTANAFPEIYILGCRNPFRFSVDLPTGWLYWGDVGPDALGPDPARGPAGFDEFNVATAAGNFGWPYFQADNRPYVGWDFATKTSGAAFDPAHPVNDSPNNSGVRQLPPAQPAFLWYPPGPSSRWPELGSGARSAMAGPVYHFDPALRSERKLPVEYDGAVLLFDWERGWIKAVWLDERRQVKRVMPLLPEARFKRPICLKLGADGALYVLEWGSNWANNSDAALVRVAPAEGP